MALQSADIRASIAILAASAGLCACNLQDRPPAPSQGAARLEPGVGFYFNQDGDMTSLAYGLANSDDVGLLLRCRKGSRRVEVSDVAQAAAKGSVVMTLASGPVKLDLKAQVMPNDETGGFLASAQVASDAPAFLAFRKTGRLSVKLMDRAEAMAATPGEQVGVARFFAACERRRR